jgi:hypothetical protein
MTLRELALFFLTVVLAAVAITAVWHGTTTPAGPSTESAVEFYLFGEDVCPTPTSVVWMEV